jgi:formate/nitrite transporter
VHHGELGAMSTSPVDTPSFPAAGLDALPPPAMARRAEDVGVAKATLPAAQLLALAVLAGAFIALGALFSTTVTAGTSELAFGVTRLLAGLTFSLGLILVVVAGAELFTGNNLVVMAWAGRRVSTARLLWGWTLVYAGNFAGAIATAALVYLARQYELGGGAVGDQALAIGAAKTSLGFGQAIALGALCNALVCLAVWLTYSARTTTDRILAVVPPIAAFVAAGFEHSVANMYFIPFALLVEGDPDAVASVGGSVDLSGLTWGAFFLDNLVPVTIGNLVGGTLMVGAVYWFVYLRGSEGSRS